MGAGTPSSQRPPRAGPTRRVLGWLAVAVLATHLLMLGGLASPLQLRLAAQDLPTPVQLRVLTPPAEAAPPARVRPPVARTARPAPEGAQGQAPEAALPEREASAAQAAASEPPLTTASTAEPALVMASAASQTLLAQATPAAPASASAVPSGPAWPLIPLGALPPSTLLSYALSGMDKGLHYHANGELRWQHSDTAYELTLTVRAFLLGSRHWRSVGRIEATGLAPTRFSDSWRNERAAHFDREQQRVVFSSNSNPAALQPGAQDQVSLYVQLAAAMAGEPERFAPGARLQVQTATVRDAQPWSLTLEKVETLQVGGRSVLAHKWLCQPRNQYEARVEFWVSPEQAWLPVRILITQASGSYIDLSWRASEPLAPLAPRA